MLSLQKNFVANTTPIFYLLSYMIVTYVFHSEREVKSTSYRVVDVCSSYIHSTAQSHLNVVHGHLDFKQPFLLSKYELDP